MLNAFAVFRMQMYGVPVRCAGARVRDKADGCVRAEIKTNHKVRQTARPHAFYTLHKRSSQIRQPRQNWWTCEINTNSRTTAFPHVWCSGLIIPEHISHLIIPLRKYSCINIQNIAQHIQRSLCITMIIIYIWYRSYFLTMFQKLLKFPSLIHVSSCVCV